MKHQNTETYAALKINRHSIMGKVESINDGELIFQPLSDDEVPLWLFLKMDIFSKTLVFFRGLSGVAVSENKSQNKKSDSDTNIRKVKIRYHNSELVELITEVMMK